MEEINNERVLDTVIAKVIAGIDNFELGSKEQIAAADVLTRLTRAKSDLAEIEMKRDKEFEDRMDKERIELRDRKKEEQEKLDKERKEAQEKEETKFRHGLELGKVGIDFAKSAIGISADFFGRRWNVKEVERMENAGIMASSPMERNLISQATSIRSTNK